ncbi:unnamed protein product, partial [Ilex paraguariensis]
MEQQQSAIKHQQKLSNQLAAPPDKNQQPTRETFDIQRTKRKKEGAEGCKVFKTTTTKSIRGILQPAVHEQAASNQFTSVV